MVLCSCLLSIRCLQDHVLDSVDDEDEVLLEMARELEKFTDYVGGSEYAHYILTPLERLATMEEVLVRDRVNDPSS